MNYKQHIKGISTVYDWVNRKHLHVSAKETALVINEEITFLIIDWFLIVDLLYLIPPNGGFLKTSQLHNDGFVHIWYSLLLIN